MKAAVKKRLKKKKKHQFDHTDFIGKVTAAGLVTSAILVDPEGRDLRPSWGYP